MDGMTTGMQDGPPDDSDTMVSGMVTREEAWKINGGGVWYAR